MLKSNAKFIFYTLTLIGALFIVNYTVSYFSKPDTELRMVANRVGRLLTEKLEFIDGFYLYSIDGKNLNSPAVNSVEIIQKLKDQNLNLLQFKGDHLIFWTSNNVIIDNPSQIKSGSSFVKLSNGWYFINKKVNKNISSLFLMLVKKEYSFQNSFLKNTFSEELNIPDYFKLSSLDEKRIVYVVIEPDIVLFGLKIDSFSRDQTISIPKIVIESLMILILFILFVFIGNQLYERQKKWQAFLLIVVVPIGFRLLLLEFAIPGEFYRSEMFAPTIYASSYPNNSLGDLLLNVLLVFGIVWYYSRKIKPIDLSFGHKTAAYAVSGIFLFFIFQLCKLLYDIFEGLILNSKIEFDLSEILDISGYSIIGLTIIGITVYTFFLISILIVRFFAELNFHENEKLAVFTTSIFAVTIYFVLKGNYNVYYLLIALFLLVVERSTKQGRAVLTFPERTLVLLIFSTIIASNLNIFLAEKEKENRKLLALKLEDAHDPIAEIVFTDIKRKIKTDPIVINYFLSAEKNRLALNDRLQKVYFTGYFSRYEVNTYPLENPADTLDNQEVSSIRLLFKNSGLDFNQALAGTDTLFQPKGIPGIQQYIGAISIKEGITEAKLFFDIRSKLAERGSKYPQVLLESNVNVNRELENYSYALYNKGKLMINRGDYQYKANSSDFTSDFKSTDSYFFNLNNFNHLVYRVGQDTQIIVSRRNHDFLTDLAIFSYILGFSILFAAAIFFLRNIGTYLEENYENISQFNFTQLLNSFNLLFKTRIQLSMIIAVMASVLVIGWVTLLNVRKQYRDQQNGLIIERINLASVNFNAQLVKDDSLVLDNEFPIKFASFADISSSDVNLYGPDGRLIRTTQPKLFDRGLISENINPRPFHDISKNGFTEYITERESLGTLNYLSAYAPIINSKNKILGYINIPYFENEEDYRGKISIFLSSIINVYSFVFLAIGIIAFVFSNSITAPLEMLLQNFKTTRIGRNKPIEWQNNDEIGAMVHEYNNMIAELEVSAHKLAMSERENAWKEMAKQIAHEIKNPLTPLRLGIQHLERSWRDKDPNFDQKFEKFSRSFVQQIDSLSFIASEFSSFAKMPETKNEVFDVKEILEQTVNIFKETESAEVIFRSWNYSNTKIFADKDQLLRSFNNLVKNALQAMPTDERGMVMIDLTGSENEVSITISDTGSGIPDEVREKVFAPNFTTKSSGMGIGLAFVKNSIENAGGMIRFNSVAGIGTTFYINLPVVKKRKNKA
ncbi:sensor histidine kinase [Solitalea lacus]|uniref:sensor histidine kinase n=1 Tax=Solitalea lacus TaxID=2911172 RepID=UPI001EDA7B1C|nr:HAMP domain-containing sensor histidine kinase [Solitalea lacus]UKJ08048.1 HAMP domain-containing histidine kinase [Solitalea lacus]